MATSERNLINEHLKTLTPNQRRFRINAGVAWTGDVTRLPSGDLLIKNPRPFHGAPKGWPDLCGMDSIEITSGMVGQKIAVFVGEEFKTAHTRMSREQSLFADMCKRLGAVFRIIRG